MSIYRGRTKQEVYLASLLYLAIDDVDIRGIRVLLDKGADPNLVVPIKTIAPIHLIIGKDPEQFSKDVLLLMLQHGGDPNTQSDDGLTPMHIAAAWGRLEVLKLLLDCGGDPEIHDINDKTALHYAIEESFPLCADLIKDYLPDKKCYKIKNDCKHFNLTLDKVLVNNGLTLGEYEIVNEYKTEPSQLTTTNSVKLNDLPSLKCNEYMIDWCNSLSNAQNGEICADLNSGGNTSDFSDMKESDQEVTKYVNVHNIAFRKVYRKRATKSLSPIAKPKLESNRSELLNASSLRSISQISGVTPLLDSHLAAKRETSSDYATCETNSLNSVERKMLDMSLFTNDLTAKSAGLEICAPSLESVKSEGISSSDLSFISVSEVYKYEDLEQGVVLYERRFLKTPLLEAKGGSVKSFVSSNVSLPETIDYEDIDADGIRRELTSFGYSPGPITVTTKRIYLKKLKQLRRLPVVCCGSVGKRVYSPELQKTLKNPDWIKNILAYRTLDEAIFRQFAAPDPARKWREGVVKASFTYLLLDPRVTLNLPARVDALKPADVWDTFLAAIFYVGKGKRSRPYAHLYEAAAQWGRDAPPAGAKLRRIADIWAEGCGVVCLHLFQNAIPVEAYTREAAIIGALRLENLANARAGNFYGVAATWSARERDMFGVFLLYKAMMIFLNEGERQLCPNDID